MADEELDYNFDDDVSLDVDEKDAGGKKQEWLRMATKGQILRAAFVYFHSYDSNAVAAALKTAKKDGKTLTRDEVQAVASKAMTAGLAKRAQDTKKSVDQLTDIDKLDLSIAHFKKIVAHYQEGLGYVVSRLGKDGADADAVWKRLPEPKTYFSTLLLLYPADGEGGLNKDALVAAIKDNKLKVIPWRFGTSIYDKIWKLNAGLRDNDLSLASQDIKLECKKPDFQEIDVSFAGGAVWQKNETLRGQVLTKALAMYDKLQPFREMTTDQLRAKLGLGGSAVEDVSSDNFQSMLDNV